MNLRRIVSAAKGVIDKRGGMGAVKEDLAELRDVAKGKGSLADKAKAAVDVVKAPGKPGEPGEPGEEPPR